MPRIYKLSRAGLRLLYKIRHHRGHGIHSPFVFNLVTKVIEEKTPYYKYEDVKEHISLCHNNHYKTNKYNRLSFRLVNYFGARHILEIGTEKGVNTLYLTAPYHDSECTVIEPSGEKYKAAQLLYKGWDRNIKLVADNILPKLTQKMDCIYININKDNILIDNVIEYIPNLVDEKTFIIVKGIRTNRRSKALWKDIAGMESRTAMLDLFNIGILFFDKSLYRWDYQISF